MHTTIQRIGAFTAMLVLAAGTTALASVTIEPSHSITLQTRGRGMEHSNPEREGVTLTATSRTGKVHITENSCRPLADVSGYHTSDREITGSSGSSYEYMASIHIESKRQEGTCAVTFSDGGHSATAHIRIVKP